MSLHPAPPNLELILYKTSELLMRDPIYLDALAKQVSQGERAKMDFDVIAFPQIWANTATCFDVSPDGVAVMSGDAFTKEYTVVVHELVTDCYCVFFGDRPCYKVTKANENFFNDLKERRMASLSKAHEKY